MAKIAKKTAENGHFLEAVKCQKIELRTVYRYINGPPGIGINFSKKNFSVQTVLKKCIFQILVSKNTPRFAHFFSTKFLEMKLCPRETKLP